MAIMTTPWSSWMKSRRALLIGALATAIVGMMVMLQFWRKLPHEITTSSYLPWHETPQWHTLLSLYDKTAAEVFDQCESRRVDTRFGITQVHMCGRKQDPPVLLFHGASAASIMFGDWIVPDLVQRNFLAVPVDFPCDVGRSIPAEPNECLNHSPSDLANWVEELVTGLDLHHHPVSLLGYSYGTTVAFVTSWLKPESVDKLVLLSPGAILVPFDPKFILSMVAVQGLSPLAPTTVQRWFMKWLAADRHFESTDMLELMVASLAVGATLLPSAATVYNDSVLHDVFDHHDTFLGIGANEVITDVKQATDRARRNGVEIVQVFPNAGHLLPLQGPNQVSEKVVEFLSNPSKRGVEANMAVQEE